MEIPTGLWALGSSFSRAAVTLGDAVLQDHPRIMNKIKNTRD